MGRWGNAQPSHLGKQCGSFQSKFQRSAALGTSLLRRSLRRSNYSSEYSVEMGGVTALGVFLVDLAAALTHLVFDDSGGYQTRLRNMASALASIRDDLANRRIPGPLQFCQPHSPGVPE